METGIRFIIGANQTTENKPLIFISASDTVAAIRAQVAMIVNHPDGEGLNPIVIDTFIAAGEAIIRMIEETVEMSVEQAKEIAKEKATGIIPATQIPPGVRRFGRGL